MRPFIRFTVTLALSAILVAGPLPSSGASETGATAPSGSVRIFQEAHADFTRRENGGIYWYLVGAGASFNPVTQRTSTRAYAARSECVQASTEEIHIILCSISTRARKIPAEDFEFDPTMSAARLVYGNTRVEWAANDEPPSPDVWPSADPSFGALAYASVDRFGSADGKVLGRKFRFRPRGWDFAYMSTGAWAAALTTAKRKIWTDDAGRIHGRLRIEIPR